METQRTEETEKQKDLDLQSKKIVNNLPPRKHSCRASV